MNAINIGRVIPIALAVFGQGAAATSSSVQDPPQPPAAALQTIVMIAGEFANAPTAGAGLVFSGDSRRMLIVTADHVVRRRSGEVAGNLEVRFRSRQQSPVPARFTGHADPALDIAVLEVQGLDKHGLSLCDQPFGWFTEPVASPIRTVADSKRRDAERRGAAVYPVGHPNGRGWTMSVVADRIVEASDTLILFQSSVISEGYSGGALLTASGEILGLIQADEPPWGRARPIVTVFDTLRSWGYPVAGHSPGALHRAVESGDLDELRRLLVAGGCSVLKERDEGGWTPLELAASSGRPAVVALLLEHGADVALPNQREPPLSRATAANDAEIVAMLLKAGADVNMPDGTGTTALFSAVRAKSEDMVRRLLAAGADVNHANSDGETPLIIAVRRENVPLTRLLLAAGANVNARSRWNVSPLSLVQERTTKEQKELYKLLLASGAVR